MPCTLTEPRLGAYLDGTLDESSAERVASHVAGCGRCSLLLGEMRAVEATLARPRRLAPAGDLTAAIMFEVRAIPSPVAYRSSLPLVLAAYIAFAWLTIAGFALFDTASARAILGLIAAATAGAAWLFAGLTKATAHLLGRQTLILTLAMGALLAIDVVAAGAVVAFYALRRNRRA